MFCIFDTAMRHHIPLSVALLFCCLAFAGCSRKDDSVQKSCSIMTIFSISGLGDFGFQDGIYTGILKSRLDNPDLFVDTYCPKSLSDVEEVIASWYADGEEEMTREFSSRRLLILCDDSYGDILEKHPEWRNDGYNDILLLDSRRTELDVYTCYVTLYGASNLAGQIAMSLGMDKAAVISANPFYGSIIEGTDGFVDGFSIAGGTISRTDDVHYLADGIDGGFTETEKAFQLSDTLQELGYNFVFPICGGSNHGVFRYARQHEKDGCFHTCGMDADQQSFSNHILFSICKRMDIVVDKFISNWLSSAKSLDKHAFRYLDSSEVEIVMSRKQSVDAAQMESMRKKAIAAEKEYFNRQTKQ